MKDSLENGHKTEPEDNGLRQRTIASTLNEGLPFSFKIMLLSKSTAMLCIPGINHKSDPTLLHFFHVFPCPCPCFAYLLDVVSTSYIQFSHPQGESSGDF